jgi:hypothetical protein
VELISRKPSFVLGSARHQVRLSPGYELSNPPIDSGCFEVLESQILLST